MEPNINTGFTSNLINCDAGIPQKVRIPMSNIYRFKSRFYKSLELDESTRNAIRLYNLAKQGHCN